MDKIEPKDNKESVGEELSPEVLAILKKEGPEWAKQIKYSIYLFNKKVLSVIKEKEDGEEYHQATINLYLAIREIDDAYELMFKSRNVTTLRIYVLGLLRNFQLLQKFLNKHYSQPEERKIFIQLSLQSIDERIHLVELGVDVMLKQTLH